MAKFLIAEAIKSYTHFGFKFFSLLHFSWKAIDNKSFSVGITHHGDTQQF